MWVSEIPVFFQSLGAVSVDNRGRLYGVFDDPELGPLGAVVYTCTRAVSGDSLLTARRDGSLCVMETQEQLCWTAAAAIREIEIKRKENEKRT